MPQEDYRYFDIRKLTGSIRFDPEDQARGEFLVRRKDSKIESISVGYEEKGHIREVIGRMTVRTMDSVHRSTVTVVFGRSSLYHLHCSAGSCGNYVRAGERVVDHHSCPHKAAAMLLLRERLEESDPGDATDRSGMALMQCFRRRFSADHAPEPEPCVHLVPFLEVHPEGVYAGFSIGIDDMYHVQDLAGLRRTVEERRMLLLKGNGGLDFAAVSFDRAAAACYEMICRHAVRTNHPAKRILLRGAAADDLFDAVHGSQIKCTDTTRASRPVDRLTVREGVPAVQLQLSPLLLPDGTFDGALLTGKLPRMLHGGSSLYCITPGALLRVPRGAAELLQMLGDAAENGQVECRFGRRHLSDLWYSILPDLRSYMYVEIEQEALLTSYISPEVQFRFDLDARRGLPSCYAVAVYEGREFSLLYVPNAVQPCEPFRDAQREQQTADLLRSWFPETDTEEKVFVCADDEAAVCRFLREGIGTLRDLGEVRATKAFQAIRIHRRLPVRIGVSVESSLLELEVLSDDLTRQELLDIIRSYRLKKQYHRLKDGTFVELDERTQELSDLLEALRISDDAFLDGDMQVPAYRAFYLDKMLSRCESMQAEGNARYEELIRSFRHVEEEPQVPESLRGIMRSYQCYGFQWMRVLAKSGFGGILADEMGLGKTLQMIAVLLAAKLDGEQGTSIVICPSSLIYNWLAELGRFAPELRAAAVAGTPNERRRLIGEAGEWDVLVTSYDLLKRDVALYAGQDFLCEILDEAQYIKNSGTDAAKAVKLLHSRSRFALTGTPIENRLSELWSIFDFLMPGFLYDYATFRRDLDTPITKYGSEAAVERLRRMTAPFILRRLKTDELQDLPEKLEEIRYARFAKKQQHVYDGQVLQLRGMLDSGDENTFRKSKVQVLADLLKIRLTCCDPSLVYEGYQGGSAKREACMELIRSAIEGGHRMLVFSSFVSMLALLEKDLHAAGIPYFKIIGETPKQERLRLVNEFNDGDVPVFLISIRTGGNGLNLTGADVVIHYDPWWSAAVEEQASGRAHRLGQKRTVTVYRLIAAGTIEERIRALQERKLEIAQPFLGGQSDLFSELTREELLGLLQ